jgi:hypothetical protein
MRLDDGTGLARAEAAARYARTVRTSRDGWDVCPPGVRMEALVAAVNAELAHVSAPPAVALLHELPPFTTPRRAWFLRGAWCVLFDPHALGGGLGDEDLGRVASAAYHEARHVEQTFRVARKLAAEGAGARRIELLLGVPAEIADAAVALPLAADDRRPWDEAAAWQENIARSDPDEPSQADTAADLLDEALDAYGRARAAYGWAAEPASPGRSGRAALRTDYVRTRERVRRLYALHDGLPFERDAWTTAALVQQHLGLEPGSPADVLASLDDDERSLRTDHVIKTGLAPTSGASA